MWEALVEYLEGDQDTRDNRKYTFIQQFDSFKKDPKETLKQAYDRFSELLRDCVFSSISSISLFSPPLASAGPPPSSQSTAMASQPTATDQNLEDIDDLEMLDSPPPSAPNTISSGTNASIASKRVTRGKRIDSDPSEDVDDKKKSKKQKSDVWEYFKQLGIVDGVEKCECLRCKSKYTCNSDSGTSHLRRHVTKCYKNPQMLDVSSLLNNQTTLLKKWKFDSKVYRDALAKCIIRHDLPFSFAEYDGFNDLLKRFIPEFKSVSRNTANVDCKSVFVIEKEKLKSVLANLRGRICLTSDVWTAVTTQGYMAVTAHYIDENWKLNSKLLSFCALESPHTGLELSSKLIGVLKDWRIESKIFSITLDNASSNDSMVRILKDRLTLLCKGEFFHVRCCAHILNIIVQEGLKATGKALEKIRDSVKYVRSSEGRLQQFQACIEEVHLGNVGGSFLRLDVATRWNATYMMLASAIKYRHAFTQLSYNDNRNYKLCPSNEEWERAERVCAFLSPFYDITNLVSGSSYPTSNLYFMQVATIQMKLNENLSCEDEVIRDMSLRMKSKFDKYWNEYSVNLALGCVLDPKRKLNFLNFCYKRLYPIDYEEKVNRVKETLYRLYGEYEVIETESETAANSTREGPRQPYSMASGSSSSLSIIDEYEQELRRMNSSQNKSQLDIYLEEACVVRDVNVLEYWRMNKDRFPQLSIMACDILGIPITTVASESSFSIGGRILHKYRSCLLPENVQALICTRSWLHGFQEVGPLDSIAQEVEEIQLSKEDSNVLDVD